MKATVSRRAMMAGIPAAAMIPASAQANGAHAPHSATTDPVFAAIKKHRQAAQALSTAHEPPDALLAQLSSAEVDALLTWLTTPPTTLAGVIATLEHAARRSDEDGNGSHVYTHLSEAALFDPSDGDPDGILKAGERFPAMIAAALRQIVAAKLL